MSRAPNRLLARAQETSMDSEDISFEDEPTQARDRRRQVVEMDSSIDIDASYPPPERRTAVPRSGVGASTGSSTGYRPGAYQPSQKRRQAADTPSPEESEIEVSGSMEEEPPARRRNMPAVGPSAAYQAAMRAGVGSSLSSSAAGARKPSAISASRRYDEDSIDELNPDLDDDYVPSYRPPAVSASYAAATAAARNPPPRQQQQQQQPDEEVSISFEDSTDAMDVRVSNNTLIKKAQALQNAGASKERRRIEQEQEAREAQRRALEQAEEEELARLAAERKADIARQEKLTQDALAARRKEADKKAAYEARIKQEQEDEEREREREEEEARQLREQAEIEDDDYADEFATTSSPKAGATATATAATAAGRKNVAASSSSLDALDAALMTDEDAEIEAARRALEEEEEAELAREREEEEAGGGGKKMLLDTQAFTSTRGHSSGTGGGSGADISFGDSADLSSARRRQEDVEDEEAEREAEERRQREYDERVRKVADQEKAEAQQQRHRAKDEQLQQHARRESLEQAVEESYEEEEFDDQSRGSKKPSRGATPPPPTAAPHQTKDERQSNSPPSQSSSSSSQPARSGAPAPMATVGDVTAPPSVFAAALATLDPQVAALVMKAVADQMVDATPNRQSAAAAAAAAASSAPQFRPSESQQAATDAWEKLLRMRAGHPRASYAPSTGSASLPAPPLYASAETTAGAHATSWEGMMAAVSASQLARTQQPVPSDPLFSKRPQSFAGSAAATYPAPLAPVPFPAYRAVHHDASQLQSDGTMARYIDRVLHSGVAEDKHRTSLRVESEKEALRRLLTFNPLTAGTSATEDAPDGVSAELAQRVGEQKQLYMQDQAILNSVLRRMLTKSEGQVRAADLTSMNRLDLQSHGGSSGGGDEKKDAAPKMVHEGVLDDGRPLPAADVIRMIEEGYPFAAYDAWQHFSTNTLARSVMLAAEPPSQTYTRHVVEQTMKQTLSELLADEKIVQSIKRAAMKKLKARLLFAPAGPSGQPTIPQAAFRPQPAAPSASRR